MANVADIKELPNSYEVERAYIACLLMNPDLIAESKLSYKDFYIPEHKKIFDAIRSLYKKSLEINIIMLSSEWCDQEKLLEIASELPSLSWFQSYETIIKQDSIFRHIISTANKLQALAYDRWELSEIFTEAKNIVDTPTGWDSWVELLEVVFDYIDNLWVVPDNICNYWYPDLDAMTNGIWAWQLIVIWAWPWTGKTMFAMNIADNITKAWVAVWMFPLEMTQIELAKRFIAKQSWISSNQLESLKNTKEEIINKVTKWLWDWHIGSFKIFKKDNRFDMIMQRIRREVIQNKTQVFIVDHLWLIVENKKWISKSDLIWYITWSFKKLAEELWIAIILLSQLNRSWQWDNEPTLSSLRDSWNIEQDANVVMFMYNPPYIGNMELIVAKVRDWEVGRLDMEYDYKIMNVSKLTRKKQ